MAGDLVSPEGRRGFISRLFGRSYDRFLSRTANVTVHRSEQLNLTVPAERATAAKDAVERWLAGHGVTTALTVEDAGDGKTRLRTKLGDADAAKLDLSADDVQSELQNVLTEALH